MAQAVLENNGTERGFSCLTWRYTNVHRLDVDDKNILLQSLFNFTQFRSNIMAFLTCYLFFRLNIKNYPRMIPYSRFNMKDRPMVKYSRLNMKNRPMVTYSRLKTSIFSEKISPANDGLFVLDGLFVHEGLYVYVQLTYKKAWIL